MKQNFISENLGVKTDSCKRVSFQIIIAQILISFNKATNLALRI